MYHVMCHVTCQVTDHVMKHVTVHVTLSAHDWKPKNIIGCHDTNHATDMAVVGQPLSPRLERSRPTI